MVLLGRSQLIADYVDKCGFPPGVFNLVNGNRMVAEAFMDSPIVKGASIVGSTPACKIVAERCARIISVFKEWVLRKTTFCDA